MEPMLPAEGTRELEDQALELVASSSRLAGQLSKQVQSAVGELVRAMNCYYSNLIEGHDTHPRDIDRAMASDYHRDPKRRALQLEARAHIELQRKLDYGEAPDAPPTSSGYITWLHSEFCSKLPEELLWVENPTTKERLRVVPGEFRGRDVQVGRHIPPPVEALPELLVRMEHAYNPSHLSRAMAIVSAAAAHHRLLWIHPFLDGNGRVARLMSHAVLLQTGVGSSLWSIARGLARNVDRYKSALAAADSRRYNDLDGRGTLSERQLVEFCKFFLEVSIDQVHFMEDLLQPSEILRRMKLYVDDEVDRGRLARGSLPLLREALLAGELERGRAADITGYQERRGRQILSSLLEAGLLVSQGPRAPVRIGFPLEVAERIFPRLYPAA